MNNAFFFQPLTFDDISLMHKWFNVPHVMEFYSLRTWTKKDVLAKLQPYILGEAPVNGFIVLMNNHPIGYVQHYKVTDYPWPNQNLSKQIIHQAAGMDVFIGEENLLGKGIGQRLIQAFIKNKIWPLFNYCIVDPDIRNVAAIQCYEKLGFQQHALINTQDALNASVTLKLMMLSKFYDESI